MAELKAMCEAAALTAVRTYIASGNVVFASDRDETSLKAMLEDRLGVYAGKPVGVLVRSAAEMAAVLADNPFPDAPGNRVLVTFLDGPPPADTAGRATHLVDEEIRLGSREIYVRYSEGMAASKLNIPAARAGTARNMNTVAKLAAMVAQL